MKASTVFWIIFGLIVVIGGYNVFSWLIRTLEESTASAEAFASVVSKQLVSTGWSLETFEGIATPDFYTTLSKGGAESFDKYVVLGKPLKVEACSLTGLNINNNVGRASLSCLS